MGDVKNVADGYGRNFLLPRKLAKIATEQTMKEAEALKKKVESMERLQKEGAQEIVASLKDMVIEVIRKASEKGTLFDGIEKKDIAQVVTAKVGHKIEEDMVKVGEAIKRVGKHTIDLELAPDITTQITLEVKAE